MGSWIFTSSKNEKFDFVIHRVIFILFQHSNDEKLQQYLQDGLCRIRLQKANIFDISALLLRPIQRIVRYPLILNELFKVNNTLNKATRRSHSLDFFFFLEYEH